MNVKKIFPFLFIELLLNYIIDNFYNYLFSWGGKVKESIY